MTDLTIPCVRCGKPAAAHGEHHYREHDPSQGKGMGGSHEHLDTLPLCRGCHRDLHDKRFVARMDGPIVTCIAPDGAVLSVRSIRPLPLVHVFERPDLDMARVAGQAVLLDDESLAYVWEQAAQWQDAATVIEAIVARAFRLRYGSYGDGWYGRAAEIIRDATGRSVSPAVLYDRAALAVALEAANWDLQLLGYVGKSTLTEAGKAPQPAVAVETVVELRAEGLPAREVVKQLRAARAEAQTSEDLPESNSQTSENVVAVSRGSEGPCREHLCAYCGLRWRSE